MLVSSTAGRLAKPAEQPHNTAHRRHAAGVVSSRAAALRPSCSAAAQQAGGGGSAASASTASAASSSSLGISISTAAVPSCVVRHARSEDYWPVAHAHTLAFYGSNLGRFWSSLMRVDRVVALHVGSEQQEKDVGRFACLVAAREHGNKASSSSSSSSDSSIVSSSGGSKALLAAEEELPMDWLVEAAVRMLLPPSLQHRFSSSYAAGGVWGAVNLDTLGGHIPAKRVHQHGVTRYVRRKRVAHLSNLAVVPAARRQGIGRRLMEAAEALALEWGCRSVALHVDPTNTAAVQMYQQRGYRRVAEQPAWEAFLEGRRVPLVLMLRRLPSGSKSRLPGAERAAVP